ncbi:hypothetical protein [Luteibacter jiangsuensis]
MTDKCTISLRLFSEEVGAEAMLSGVGLEASVTHEKGAPRQTPKGTPLDGVYSASFAVFPLVKNDHRWLSESIAECVARLTHAQDLFTRIKAAGGRAELFIGWFLSGSSGDILASSLLLQVANLGLDLSFDIYPADAAEES